MSIITQQANNPTSMLGGDAEVKPELGQSFPGRTKQLWHFDPNYDQGGDQEIHVCVALCRPLAPDTNSAC